MEKIGGRWAGSVMPAVILNSGDDIVTTSDVASICETSRLWPVCLCNVTANWLTSGYCPKFVLKVAWRQRSMVLH